MGERRPQTGGRPAGGDHVQCPCRRQGDAPSWGSAGSRGTATSHHVVPWELVGGGGRGRSLPESGEGAWGFLAESLPPSGPFCQGLPTQGGDRLSPQNQAESSSWLIWRTGGALMCLGPPQEGLASELSYSGCLGGAGCLPASPWRGAGGDLRALEGFAPCQLRPLGPGLRAPPAGGCECCGWFLRGENVPVFCLSRGWN